MTHEEASALLLAKHDPSNGGECPGYIDCQDPDAPLADFFRCVWRGPEPMTVGGLMVQKLIEQIGPEPGGEERL